MLLKEVCSEIRFGAAEFHSDSDAAAASAAPDKLIHHCTPAAITGGSCHVEE